MLADISLTESSNIDLMTCILTSAVQSKERKKKWKKYKFHIYYLQRVSLAQKFYSWALQATKIQVLYASVLKFLI